MGNQRGFVVRGIAYVGYSSPTTERVRIPISWAKSEKQARGVARDLMKRRNPGTMVYLEIESVRQISLILDEETAEPRRKPSGIRQLPLFGR